MKSTHFTKAEITETNRRIVVNVSECKRNNLCVDCDDESCIRHGDPTQDCPKYHCDRLEPHKQECETCEFLKEYQEEMRKVYRKENKSED